MAAAMKEDKNQCTYLSMAAVAAAAAILRVLLALPDAVREGTKTSAHALLLAATHQQRSVAYPHSLLLRLL